MPKFLLSKKYLSESVAIILGFSIPFLLIYRPFSATIWFAITPLRNFAFTILFYAIGLAILITSKMAMYRYQAHHTLTVTRFVLWIFSEYICLALVYMLLTPHVTPDVTEVTVSVVLKIALCVGLILIIPYSFMSLYAAYKTKKEELEMLKLSYRSEAAGQTEKIIRLYDYKGDLAISIPETSIFYMEAQDNYVQVIYDDGGNTQKYLLRCPTQKLETMIEGTALVRCHRSFIVNLRHLACFKRGHNRATIELDSPGAKEIPVSKSYYKRTLECLTEVNPSADSLIMRT